MEDLHDFDCLLRAETRWSTGRVLADDLVSGLWINHIVGQSLCLQAVTDREDLGSIMKEAFRLGVLLYLAEMRRHFGVYPVLMQIHMSKLKALLDNSGTSWHYFMPLKLWVVVMALMEAKASEDKAWFASQISVLAKELNLTSGESLEDLLKGLFWNPQTHSKLLWENIRLMDLFNADLVGQIPP